MGAKICICLFAYALFLLFALSCAYSFENFVRERKEILKLCVDVTDSEELQLSFECAERMKISTLKGKHIKTSKFMGVRIQPYLEIRPYDYHHLLICYVFR